MIEAQLRMPWKAHLIIGMLKKGEKKSSYTLRKDSKIPTWPADFFKKVDTMKCVRRVGIDDSKNKGSASPILLRTELPGDHCVESGCEYIDTCILRLMFLNPENANIIPSRILDLQAVKY